MEPRIRPNHEESKVEGVHVPPAEQPEPTLLEDKFADLEANPKNIPSPRESSTLEGIPAIDNETNPTDINEKPGRSKRFVGAVAAFLALTVPIGIVVAAKNNNNSDRGEVVATSSPFPTTTPAAVIPPTKHETVAITTATTAEIPKNERIYTLDGQVTSRAKMKEEVFTTTTAEASTPRKVAENHIGPMLSAVANFGVEPLNQGLRNLYTSPKTGERGLAVYNRDQLLDTDLLDNTGLKNSPVNQLNLLNILVAQNKENVSYRSYTEAILSDITVDESAPAMNGKKTSVVEATLVLKRLSQGSNSDTGESRSHHLQCYITFDSASDIWIFEKGSFTIT